MTACGISTRTAEDPPQSEECGGQTDYSSSALLLWRSCGLVLRRRWCRAPAEDLLLRAPAAGEDGFIRRGLDDELVTVIPPGASWSPQLLVVVVFFLPRCCCGRPHPPPPIYYYFADSSFAGGAVVEGGGNTALILLGLGIVLRRS